MRIGCECEGGGHILFFAGNIFSRCTLIPHEPKKCIQFEVLMNDIKRHCNRINFSVFSSSKKQFHTKCAHIFRGLAGHSVVRLSEAIRYFKYTNLLHILQLVHHPTKEETCKCQYEYFDEIITGIHIHIPHIRLIYSIRVIVNCFYTIIN